MMLDYKSAVCEETIDGGNISSKERYLFLDIMKFISLVGMPCTHCIEFAKAFGIVGRHFPSRTMSTLLGMFYLIGPGVFMFCMGAGLVLSKNQTPKALFNRGWKLLLTGFLLNIARASVFLWDRMPDRSSFMTFWLWLWGSDILYFAGLYFLLFSLFRYFRLPDKVIIAITCAMLIVCHLVMPVTPRSATFAELFGNFVYVDADSCFPLLSWAIVPTTGYLYMKGFLNSEKRAEYVLRVAAIAQLVLIFMCGTLRMTRHFHSRYFLWGEHGFMMDVPSMIVTICVALVYAAIIYSLSGLLKKGIVTELIQKVSSCINSIYCIHWVLVSYLIFALSIVRSHPIRSGVKLYLLGIPVFVASTAIAFWYKEEKRKHFSQNQIFHQG